MIECVTRKNKKKKIRAKVCFVSFIIFVITIILYICFIVNPMIIRLNKSVIMSKSTHAISEAVYSIMEEQNILYDDLVKTTYGQDGQINLISVDGLKANKLARLLSSRAQSSLEIIGNKGIQVSLGMFTGLAFLYNVGPKVTLKLTPIGIVTTDMYSEFTSIGINQTSHKVYITIEASLEVILPFSTRTIDSTTNVLLTESVIVGKVPNVYLDSGVNKINLIP
ncbi:MAG: sporulation protein YunB [Clostridia bacterium]|nr:sporulation protein YunB [Clostridia bacterium]